MRICKQACSHLALAIAVFFCAVIAISSTSFAADGSVVIADTFTDEAFRSYVVENYDTDKDGSLNAEEIAAATELNLEESGVASLEGIQVLTALKIINVNWTAVASIDTSNAKDLEELHASYTMDPETYERCLASVDVTNNPKLKILDISGSQVSDIDVTKNPELEELHIYVSNISSIDVSENPKLRRLDANHTGIENIDVSNNPELFALNVEFTGVSEVDVTKNPKLYEVYLTGDNKVTSLDITKNPELVHLRISGTSITDIDLSQNKKLAAFFNEAGMEEDPATWEEVEYAPAPLKALDFSNNPELYEVYLDGMPISSIDVSGAKGLNHLHLSDTNISSLDVSKNTALVSLTLENTPIKKLDISNNKNLHRLNISNTSIENMKDLDLTSYSDFGSLEAENAGLESVKFGENPKLHEIKLGGNGLKELDLKESMMDPGWYQTVSLGSQKADAHVYKNETGNTYDLHRLVGDISKVSVKESENYTYDEVKGIITFNADERSFDYVYTTDFRGETMQVNATVVNDLTPEPAPDKGPKKGDTVKVSGNVYKILSVKSKTVALSKAANKKSVTVPATVKVSGKSYKVTKIAAKAFKKSKARTVTIKTKKLTKASVKGSLIGSKVTKINVKVGKVRDNKRYLAKYKKIFTKKNAGKKVKITR